MVEFAELCAKTNFSLLEGASRPEEMVNAAHDLGIFALATADRYGLYGLVRAHTAARKVALRYVVAAEVPLGSSSLVLLVQMLMGTVTSAAFLRVRTPICRARKRSSRSRI